MGRYLIVGVGGKASNSKRGDSSSDSGIRGNSGST